jgi:hypothetical protein
VDVPVSLNIFTLSLLIQRGLLMYLFLKNAAIYGLILGVGLTSSGCDQKTNAPPQKTAKQTQAEKIAEEQSIKLYQQQLAQMETDLQNATPDKIRAILASCKSSILNQAKSENTSPFDVFMVDEYSADVYQAAAYVGNGNISSEDERVKRFLKARKAGEKDLQFALDLSYSVMFTRDSFSGPQKEPRSYNCHLEQGLSVRVI